ncbi:MAG TPA: EamA family transporter [Frankiaceae bacterium]|jgi:drug/metabolite transporter (DMT)-like permease|nr:EamA family transporter [Frankiaceae bacterium]
MAAKYRVGIALAAIYVVWGSTYLAIRYAIGADTGERGLPPLMMGGVRFALAGALMFAWAARRPAADGEPDPLGRPQWLACGFIGLALLLGGNGLVMLAEQTVPSGIAAVVVALVPIWTALFGFVLGGERLRRLAAVGLLIGFAGAVVLANPSGADRVPTGGVLMLLFATLSWSTGSYYAKSAPVPRRPLVMTAMEMLCGGAGLFVAGLLSGEAGDLHLTDAGWKAWTAFAYLVVFGSMLAFTAYAWLLRNARLSLTTTYAYVNPTVAVLLGALFLDERLTGRTIAASAVIVLGVALVVSSRPAPTPTEGAPMTEAESEDALR